MPQHKPTTLDGITLAAMLEALQSHYEWEGLAERVDVRCFKNNPSMKSSLAFLRRTPWARERIEKMYVELTLL